MIRIFLSFVVTMRMIKVRWCFNLIIFVVVISFYMAHLREGTSRIPRYVCIVHFGREWRGVVYN